MTTTKTNNSTRSNIGPAERAVYELVTRGAISTLQAPLYRRQIANLAKVGMITKEADGLYRPSTIPPAPPKAVRPPKPVLATLVTRVPQDLIAILDALGSESRSEAARLVLTSALRPEVLDLLDIRVAV